MGTKLENIGRELPLLLHRELGWGQCLCQLGVLGALAFLGWGIVLAQAAPCGTSWSVSWTTRRSRRLARTVASGAADAPGLARARWPGRFRVRTITLVLGLAALLGVASRLPTAWAQEEIFVANYATNSVLVYARTASGNTAPLRTLKGPATGLNGPGSLAVDPVNSELLVVNYSSDSSVTVYARTASGDTAPLRTLKGPATGLNRPSNLFVDTVNNELVVANFGAPLAPVPDISSITVYARTADGNRLPLRTLKRPELVGPLGLAVDTVNNELLVAKNLHATIIGPPPPFVSVPALTSVLVYARTASGNTAPLRTLEGDATGLTNPQFLAVTTLP